MVSGSAVELLALRRWPGRRDLAWCATGLALGAGLAVWYRVYLGCAAWPSDLRAFAPTALLIGGAEELVYRGYMQGRLRPLGSTGTVLATSAFHAAYKGALFAGPRGAASAGTLVVLVGFTFGVGALLGVMRERSGSLWPCLLTHGLFDVLVYGETPMAPWWVWG